MRKQPDNLNEIVGSVILTVANYKQVTPEMVLSRSRKPPMPYCRKLVAYVLKTRVTSLRNHNIAEILGFKPKHSLVSLYCSEIMWLYRRDDEVKSDVQNIEKSLIID